MVGHSTTPPNPFHNPLHAEMAILRKASRALAWYEGRLAANPMLTNVCTTTGIITIGDMLAQRLQHNSGIGRKEAGTQSTTLLSTTLPSSGQAGAKAAALLEREAPAFQLNTTRSITMSTFAALIYAPYIVTVYRIVGARFGAATSMVKAVLQGTVANLACGAPLNAAVFMYGPYVEHWLEGHPKDPGAVTLSKMKIELIPITIVSAAVWIPATAINFRFFPARYRTVFASVVSVGWSCYTSVVVHR